MTRDKYILPNGYKGFFGVLYQSNIRFSHTIENGSRIFLIAKNGICESDYSFAKGSIKQEFFYQNNSKINSFDFALFYQMNNRELVFLDKKPVSSFVICFYADNINGGGNSLAIYIISSSNEILRLQKKSEKIFFYLNSLDFNWQENKESLAKNIARLNKELADKKPPFN